MTFENWLKEPGLFRCVLVEIETSTGTFYFSNAAYRTGATDTPVHTPYDPYIIGGLEITRAMSEVFTGFSSSLISDIELYKTVETEAIGDIEGQAIRVYLGDKSWPKSQFQLVMSGIGETVTPESNVVRVSFRERAINLAKPILTEVYNSGPSEGQIKPLCIGRCFNVTPKLIDAANHVYQFNTVTSYAVTAAKFNGDIVPPANYTLDLASGTITFLVKPQGNITLDVDGAVIAGNWLQTATDFINYLMATKFGEAPVISDLPGYLLGYYVDSEIQYDTLIDEICSSVGGYWFYNRLGVFMCGAFIDTGSTVIDEITDDQNLLHSRNQRRKIPALKKLTLGYQKNWTVLDNVAPVVFDTDATLAQQLSATELVTVTTQAVTGDTATASTLIVNKADAITDANRRLTLKSIPRFVYETEQLAGIFNRHMGDELSLETAGDNGDRAIITRITENLLTGRSILEFWQ